MLETGDSKTMQVAVYGGSFNPPHICHQLTIFYALQSCNIDQVWLVPCNQHAFGKALAPYGLRHRLCELLAEPFGDSCQVNDIERTLPNENRTIDTMESLASRHPDIHFSLILGSDIRGEKDRWKRFDDLQTQFPIIWIGRQNHFLESQDRLVLPDLSSTKLREALKTGQSVQGWVPKNLLSELGKTEWVW